MKHTIRIVVTIVIVFALLAIIELGFWLMNQPSTIAFIVGILLNTAVILGTGEFIYNRYKKKIKQ
jgi:uncharacterized membrane protein